MKHIIITAITTLLFFTTSCTEILGPMYAENQQTKDFVLKYATSRGNSVKMINWEFSQSAGDAYDGYFVFYNVNNNSEYILIELIEFYEEEKWEMTYIGRSSSLSDLHDLLY